MGQFELEFQPDAANILERFEAWWLRDILDRPPVTLAIEPRKPFALPAKTHASDRERWFDTEYRLACAEAVFAQRDWLGDTLPVFKPELGPEVLATLFGVELEFGDETTWSVPIVSSCREIPYLKPDFECSYWRKIRELTDRSLKVGQGKWLTSFTDFHCNGDLLASLRDPEALCLELIDDPQSVRIACEHVTPVFLEAYEDLVGRLLAVNQPVLTWLPVPHRGRMLVPNCDFAALISREMFEMAIWPSILIEIAHCERTIFHLDGPSSLQHLDLVLDCDALDGLQWVYGAGHGPASRWIDIYRRAQAKNKAIQIICENLGDAREVMKHLEPEGVWLDIEEPCSRAEGEAFLRDVERWR